MKIHRPTPARSLACARPWKRINIWLPSGKLRSLEPKYKASSSAILKNCPYPIHLPEKGHFFKDKPNARDLPPRPRRSCQSRLRQRQLRRRHQGGQHHETPLRLHRFATELVDLGPKAGKGLFATNKPGAQKFDIMFNAHLDTVFPDGPPPHVPSRLKTAR